MDKFQEEARRHVEQEHRSDTYAQRRNRYGFVLLPACLFACLFPGYITDISIVVAVGAAATSTTRQVVEARARDGAQRKYLRPSRSKGRTGSDPR